MSTLQEQIAAAIAERDRILLAMDVEAAKAFVVKHGGSAPSTIDWTTVLHLARFECEKLPQQPRQESRIYLAREGMDGLMSLPQGNPYADAALNLIFPKRLTDDWIRQREDKQT